MLWELAPEGNSWVHDVLARKWTSRQDTPIHETRLPICLDIGSPMLDRCVLQSFEKQIESRSDGVAQLK